LVKLNPYTIITFLDRSAIDSSNTTALVAGVTATTGRVHDFYLKCHGANDITVRRGSTKIGFFSFDSAGGQIVLPYNPVPHFVGGTAESIYLDTSTAARITATAKSIRN
jgi:hypothetical protein